MTTEQFVMLIGIILTVLNILDRIINLKKNANAPIEDIKKRLDVLEAKQKENDDRFLKGNDQFRRLYEFSKIFMQVNLAFIDFETAFCQHTNYTNTSDLEKARKTLQESLTDLKTQM